MLKKILPLAFLAAILVVSGCTGSSGNIIKLPGHGDQLYQFSYDVAETLQIPVNSPDSIKQIMDNNDHYTFVFDGSDTADNGRFRVSIINIVTKLKIYYSIEKDVVLGTGNFNAYYFIENNNTREWYLNEEKVQAPLLRNPTIWLRGPSSGNNETSVNINGNIVYINGASGRGIERAADRFVLAVFAVS